MGMVFYDLANIRVDFNDALEQIVQESVAQDFDHEKTTALIAALRLLRSRKNSVKLWIIGTSLDGLVAKVEKICHLIFESEKIDIRHGETSQLLTGRDRDIDVLLNAHDDELNMLTVVDRAIELCADESFIMLSSFREFSRFDATISRRTQVQRIENRGFVPIVESYFALFSRGFNFFTQAASRRHVDYALQDRCLFVFGCQRSATSLVFQILNSSSDILISFEANAHIDLPLSFSSTRS